MQAWQATVQDEAGNVIFNPAVTVYEADGVTLATIYNEDGSPKANPFIGSLEGFVQFWALPGTYKIEGASGADRTEVWDWYVDGVVDNYAQAISLAARTRSGRVDAVIGGYAVSWVRRDGGTCLGGGWVPLGDATPSHFVASPETATADLQAWLDYGGVLRGDGKSYITSATINVTQQATEIYGPVIFEHATASPTPVIRAEGITGLVIEGVSIDGRKDLKPNVQTEAHGIYTLNCFDAVIRRNQIRNTHEHAISIYGHQGEYPYSERVMVDGNFIFDCGNSDLNRGYGIWAFGFLSDLIYTNNFIQRCIGGVSIDDSSSSGPPRDARKCIMSNNIIHAYGDCIRYESAFQGVISGNICTSEYDPDDIFTSNPGGIVVRSIQTSTEPVIDVRVFGNTVTSNTSAVYIGDASNVVVIGNNLTADNGGVSSLAYPAVAVEKSNVVGRDSDNVSIVNNDIQSTSAGVVVRNFSGFIGVTSVKIAENTIKYIGASPPASTANGVHVIACHSWIVSGNVITGFYHNIRALAAYGDDNDIRALENNKIRQAFEHGISITGQYKFRVRGNVVHQSGGLSFYTAENGGQANNRKNEISGNDFGGEVLSNDFSTLGGNNANRMFSGYTSAQIGSASHAINTVRKCLGVQVLDTDSNRVLFARGASPTSPWYTSDGAISITPS